MQPERSSFSSKEQAILSEIDADGDGLVSEDELRAYLERHQGARYSVLVPPGAAKVRVHGLVLQTPGQDPKPYEGVCGNYVRAEDVCNGRAIFYMKAQDAAGLDGDVGTTSYNVSVAPRAPAGCLPGLLTL